MTLYARLLNAIETQQRETYVVLVQREQDERNRTAYPAKVIAYDANEKTVAVSIDGGDGFVKAQSLTNAQLKVGTVVGYFKSGDGVGFVDAPSIV